MRTAENLTNRQVGIDGRRFAGVLTLDLMLGRLVLGARSARCRVFGLRGLEGVEREKREVVDELNRRKGGI